MYIATIELWIGRISYSEPNVLNKPCPSLHLMASLFPIPNELSSMFLKPVNRLEPTSFWCTLESIVVHVLQAEAGPNTGAPFEVVDYCMVTKVFLIQRGTEPTD